MFKLTGKKNYNFTLEGFPKFDLCLTRNIREYSPAGVLFMYKLQSMTITMLLNVKYNLDIANKMHIYYVVNFYLFVLKILNGNEILTSIIGHNSVTNMRQISCKYQSLLSNPVPFYICIYIYACKLRNKIVFKLN